MNVITGDLEVYRRLTRRRLTLVLGMIMGLLALIILAILAGAANITIKEVFLTMVSLIVPHGHIPVNELARRVILELRLPRVIMACLTGIALAGSGAVMQGCLENPLVSPYTLGLSSGASFGAALAIVLGARASGGVLAEVGPCLVVASAFAFGLLSMLLVYSIARLRATTSQTLILGGVAIGYLFSALVSSLKYFSDTHQLQEVVFWLMGGLWVANWQAVALTFLIVSPAVVFMWRHAWDLNALSAGEEIAQSLGVQVKRVRLTLLILASLASAAVIAFVGIIGFIGLVGPHITRLILGADHRFLIPGSCLVGATLLLLADTFARTIISPTEIPVGIITSAIGAPFFIYLLLRKGRH